jgi:hypothetical protein
MLSGGCLCGAVRYHVEGAPEFSVLCYCRDCQRASGTGHVPVMGARRSRVQISGATAHYGVRAERGGLAIRHFCPTCGSLLFGKSVEERDEVMSIYVGTLDDPSAFNPTAAICVRSRARWDTAVAGLREFQGMPPAAPDTTQ